MAGFCPLAELGISWQSLYNLSQTRLGGGFFFPSQRGEGGWTLAVFRFQRLPKQCLEIRKGTHRAELPGTVGSDISGGFAERGGGGGGGVQEERLEGVKRKIGLPGLRHRLLAMIPKRNLQLQRHSTSDRAHPIRQKRGCSWFEVASSVVGVKPLCFSHRL